MIEGDTIGAIATPAGTGGLAVLRLSGPRAIAIARHMCEFLPDIPQSHRAYYGPIRDELGEVVDQVVLTHFAEGRSYTGEATVEISCHGSSYIAERILNLMVFHGARIANRGEFTARAFMNGRLDLAQAEAVLDLIESKSRVAARQALRQLEGGVSGALQDIENELTWCLAHLEASIDFSTEGLEVVSQDELLRRFRDTQERVEKLRDSYHRGRLIREGVRFAIVGQPNVGKSSLLNALLQENRAIVNSRPGTTRDIVTGELLIGGLRAQVLDTAGLRNTQDEIELEGISRGRQSAGKSDLVLYLFSLEQGLSDFDLREMGRYGAQRVLLVGTKSDLVSREEARVRLEKGRQAVRENSVLPEVTAEAISIQDSASIEHLKAQITKLLRLDVEGDEMLISRARHFANLEQAAANLERGGLLIRQNMSSEFVALELKEALVKLQEILGKRYDDEILDRVFKEFCIGK